MPASSQIALSVKNRVGKTEKKEKKGAYGEWRKAYCAEYRRLMARTREAAHERFTQDLKSRGGTIRCEAGCTFCCHQYLTVSLAQGLVIVDHLYSNKILLRNFLRRYALWQDKASDKAGELDRIRTHSVAHHVPAEQVITETRALTSQYFLAGIACPFLVDNKCSIYEVRPPSCASLVSLSEPTHCAPDALHTPELRKIALSDGELVQLIGLGDPRLMMYELSLPVMVYRLLTEGGEALMQEAPAL
ncbi:MAG: hypothetical protein AAGF19_03435 [Pseudomonadota bacterium]